MNPNAALRPGFNPVTVGLMVVGFVVFWPLGLGMLAYILWGHRFGSFFAGIKAGFERAVGDKRVAGWSSERSGSSGRDFRTTRDAWTGDTGNAAFDDYRRVALERLEAERQRLEDERREFESFMQNLRRARDQEEFDRFMGERRRSGGAERGSNDTRDSFDRG